MQEITEEAIWSNVDFPYSCLKDIERTTRFQKAIDKTVSRGDVVLDAGSGSGIFALMAAAKGAKIVYAIEIDHTLAVSLRATAAANGFEDTIVVIEKDVLEVDIKETVDVVISELMDTALIDELQVPALNYLRKKGIIGENTKIIPSECKSYLQPAFSDNDYYGYKILIPKHEWPFYNQEGSGWYKSNIIVFGEKHLVNNSSFMHKVEPLVEKKITFQFDKPIDINSLSLSSVITLADDDFLGATNALNSDKIIPITEMKSVTNMSVEISYQMGGGYKTLNINTNKIH